MHNGGPQKDLNDLTDVDEGGGWANKDFLQYNSTSSNFEATSAVVTTIGGTNNYFTYRASDKTVATSDAMSRDGNDNITIEQGSLSVRSANTPTPLGTTDGAIYAENDVVAYSSSDERLKENIKTIEGTLEILSQITGVEFDWKEGFEEVNP